MKLTPTKPNQTKNNRIKIEDMFQIIENNRSRIRTLGNMVLTVGGLLLSTLFVLLFFVLQDKSTTILPSLPVLLLCSIALLIISISLSVYSAFLRSPSAIYTKIQLVDSLLSILHRENRRVMIAFGFMVVAIIVFAFGFGLFILFRFGI